MSDPVQTLVLDLLEWIGTTPRPYDEVMAAWRTSCPRFPVWEEADERGLIARQHDPDRGTLITLTAAGRAHLQQHRPAVGNP